MKSSKAVVLAASLIVGISGRAGAETLIGDIGAFFVGARAVEPEHPSTFRRTAGRQFAVAGAAYVEYFLPPEDKITKPPLVLFPGLGLSASLFLMKPPGGDSWVNHFVGHGYPVYLFYRPGEGASGFFSDDINGVIAGQPVDGLQPIPRAGGISNAGAARRGTLDGFYDDQQFPRDPDFALQVFAANMPQAAYGPATEGYRNSAAMGEDGGTAAVGPASPHYDGGARALLALLEKIGPAIVVGHSLAGPTIMNTAAVRPELFRLVVGLEPAGCPVNQAAGLAGVPFMHVEGERSPEFYIDDPQRLARTRQVSNDCDALGAAIVAQGGRAEAVYLGQHGEIGNSHYLMVDTNNLRVAELMRHAMERLVAEPR